MNYLVTGLNHNTARVDIREHAAASESTDRAHRSGTWGSAGSGTSCTRWPDIRSRHTDRDVR